MKITFSFKAKLRDEFEDADVERICSTDEIVNELIREFKCSLSERGTVDITDFSHSIE